VSVPGHFQPPDDQRMNHLARTGSDPVPLDFNASGRIDTVAERPTSSRSRAGTLEAIEKYDPRSNVARKKVAMDPEFDRLAA